MTPSFSLDAMLDSIRSGADTAIDAVGAVKDEVVDLATGSDHDADRRSHQAQEDGNDARDVIYDENGQITNAAGPGVEMLPPVVVPEAFAAMSHEEMVAHVNAFRPGDVLSNAAMWTGAHAALEPLVNALWNWIDPILEHEWTGAASAAAKAAVRQYSDQSHSMLTLFDLVSNKLMESHSGLEQTALMMPPLTSGMSGSALVQGFAKGALAGPAGIPIAVFGAMSAEKAEADAARQEAIAVMTTVYTPVVMQSDLGVPALPPPFDPTTFGGSPSTGGGGPVGFPGAAPGGGSPSSVPTTFPGQFPSADGGPGGDVPAQNPADTTTAGVQPTQNGTPGSGQPSAGSGSGSPFGSGSSPSDTHAAGLGSGGYGGGTAGGAGSSGRGSSGRGYGAGGMSGAARGAFGSAGSQSAGGGSGLLEGAAARGGAAGRGGGMSPGGGMMGGGGKSGGGQDSEHKTAGYLITVDNGDELVGDLPLVAPPVIG